MARSRGRSQRCSPQDARNRQRHAARFLEVAEIAAGEHERDPEYASVAVSLAVLAGPAELRKALRSARSVFEFAEGVLRR